MYFEDDTIPVPPLVPIKSKRKRNLNLEEQKKQEIQQAKAMKILALQFEKQHPQDEAEKINDNSKKAPVYQNIEQFEKKYSNLQEKGQQNQIKQKQDKHMIPTKQQQLQGAKFMVANFLAKINAKNISQELNPVSNGNINTRISMMDKQIQQLKVQAQNKENSLISNPNNQFLRNQLSTIKGSIDKCVTIKELYNEKINLRNKVSSLQKTILHLKGQNQNLKIKIKIDEENIQREKQGLPSKREQELKQKLDKSQKDLQKVTAIKQQFEDTVGDIIKSFKRLYEEADAARLIVVNKLRMIEQKQRNNENEKESSQKKSVSFANNQDKFMKATQNRDTSNIDMSKLQKLTPNSQKQNIAIPKNFLQDQFKKMKNSQNMYKRNNYKK